MFLQSSTIFYISLQSFTICFFLKPFHSARSLSEGCTVVPSSMGMCQAKGLQEDLGRARAATAELEVQTARCHAE